MYYSQFIKLYNNVNEEESRFFKKFVLSGIRLKNKNVLKLFDYLFSKKNLTESNIKKEKAFRHVYPGIKYDDLRMRHLMSEAKDALEYYFAYYQFHYNDFLQQKLLIQDSLKRKAGEYAFHVIENFDKKIENEVFRNENYYQYKSFLIENRYKIETENSRQKLGNYNDMIDIILQKSILEIFKHTCLYLMQNQFSDNKMQTEYLKNYLLEIQSEKYNDNILLQIYYNLYLMLTELDSKAYFVKTKDLLDHNQKIIDRDELKDLYLILLNYCIKQYNKNELSFANIILEIYENGIKNKFLLENNELNKFTFTNYITLAIKQNYLSRAEDFIKKWNQLINVQFREHTLNYNLARLYYAQKDYKKSARILMSITFEDDLWELNAKLLQLKISYETQEWDLLNNGTLNFYNFIKRKKNIGYHKDYFLSTVKSFKYLLNAGVKTKKQIEKQIDQMIVDNAPEKDWFIKQLKLIK